MHRGERRFYSYTYPEPPGFQKARVNSKAASFNLDLGEFTLPYTAVREASDPDAVLPQFLQSTYEAVADLGKWDRDALERGRKPPHNAVSPADPLPASP